MKKCCMMCLNIFKCKKDEKTSALKTLSLIEESNLLLPKTESTRGVIERNELNTFGKVPSDIKGIIDLTLFTNSMVYKMVCAKEHCLVLMEDRSLLCFGKNDEGQLGQPIKDNPIITSLSRLKIVIDNISNYIIEDIAAGDNFSLLLLKSNNNKNHIIRLGIDHEAKYKDSSRDNDISNSKIVHIEDIPNVNIKNIFVFGQRSLLLTYTNDIFIGGIDFESNIIDHYIQFAHFNNEIVNMSLGSSHCIILTNEGKLFGVGDNTYGELGSGEMNQKTFSQITFKEFTHNQIIKVAVGARHTLFLLSNGELYCIGDNSEIQCCGDTSRVYHPLLIDIGCQLKIIDVYAGYSHNLIILGMIIINNAFDL